MRRTFNELYAFTVVARHRSFTRAAAQLGMSQSALSQTVKNLEEDLGVRLLTRSTRSVFPTEAGERLLSRLGPQFDDMEEALDELNNVRTSPRGTIRISAGEHAAITLLQPKITSFLSDYPDVSVEIAVDAGMIDIVAEGFDAGVRLGEQVAKDMIAVRISPDIRMCMVATPDYLSQYPAPTTPEELTNHRCINTRMPTHGGVFVWEMVQNGEEIRVRVEGPATFNSLPLRLAATLDSVGIGYMPFDVAAPHITEERLLPVLESYWPTWDGYHLYYPNRRQMSPAFRLLIDHLRHR
ncbi:LysR family transcriptional regulator [uncultured Cohaesibacter sp.]|uniref:LysR family transcriptional regulator n=1 Tax=uncultured Cohaesibacter sp. TaxID=1002546 RepID=UPI0029311213|nr:LysR family transcriptional regulator [uncultured Cohaesibacter sp.]